MNNYDTIISYLIAAISILFGLYAWLKPRIPSRVLAWYSTNKTPLVAPAAKSIPSLTIMFGESPIQKATLVNIKIWNGGASAIKFEDTRNLKFTFNNGQILNAWVTSATKGGSNLKLHPNISENCIDIQFDFLNRGDGVELAIIHDGDPEQSPSLEGRVIDGHIKTTVSLSESRTLPNLIFIPASFLIIMTSITMFHLFIDLLSKKSMLSNVEIQQWINQSLRSSNYYYMLLIGLLFWGFASFIVGKSLIDRNMEPKGSLLSSKKD